MAIKKKASSRDNSAVNKKRKMGIFSFFLSISSYPIIWTSPFIYYDCLLKEKTGAAVNSIMPVAICVSLFAAIIGVVFGHIHLYKIKSFPEEYNGKGLSIAGVLLGYIFVTWTGLGIYLLWAMWI